MFVVASLVTACVETAECDQSSPCDDEARICFEFECRPRCDVDDDCEGELRCISCDANDSCYGVDARACVDPALFQ